MNKKQLSIIIVNYNTSSLLKGCLESIINNMRDVSYEIIVVDNASTDLSVEMLKSSFPRVALISNQKNTGYASGNNIGIKASSGDYILMLNSDTILLSQIAPIIDFMENDKLIGMAGCAIYDSEMRLSSPLLHFPGFISELYKLTIFSLKDPAMLNTLFKRRPKKCDRIMEVDWVEGCFMLTKRCILDQIGYMDERYFLYYEDIDLCYLIKKKLRAKVIYYPYIKLMHLGGRSTTFSNALYLRQYYLSATAYFLKHRGRIYVFIFSLICTLCWTTLFVAMGLLRLIFQKEERVIRKHDMLAYVLRHALKDLFGRQPE